MRTLAVMASKLLLLFLVLIPSAFNQCNVEKAQPFFQRSVYEFSLELITRLAEENDNHFVTSALSSWTLLSAVSLGASEETLIELKQVLRLHPHRCYNSKFFEIIKDVTSAKDGATLERSSTLFVDERMQLKEAFKNKVKKTEVSEIETLPFENFVEVANTINEYVSRATHGVIDDIVSPNDLEGVYLVLIDALYFKGSWHNKFSVADTEISAFYDERGNQVGDVNLMFSEQHANVTLVPNIQAEVLELPYGYNGRFSMLIFLPVTGVPLSDVLSRMKTISLRSIFTLYGQRGRTSELVQISLPKFEIRSDLDNMKELLNDMGLKTMFDSNQARFPDISDYSLYISNFIQKASIEVTEEGSEASVSSAAFMESRSYVEASQFTANRPFLFMIVDRQYEVPLFTGAYSKPSIY